MNAGMFIVKTLDCFYCLKIILNLNYVLLCKRHLNAK